MVTNIARLATSLCGCMPGVFLATRTTCLPEARFEALCGGNRPNCTHLCDPYSTLCHLQINFFGGSRWHSRVGQAVVIGILLHADIADGECVQHLSRGIVVLVLLLYEPTLSTHIKPSLRLCRAEIEDKCPSYYDMVTKLGDVQHNDVGGYLQQFEGRSYSLG